MADLESQPGAELTVGIQHDRSGVPILLLGGELDSSDVGALQAAIVTALARSPRPRHL